LHGDCGSSVRASIVQFQELALHPYSINSGEGGRTLSITRIPFSSRPKCSNT
jgi:hypothetical protein